MGAGMSDVIRRRADGSWGQGDDVPTYTSDHAETWFGTRDKSMEHVSDEYANNWAHRTERKRISGNCTCKKGALLEENGKLRKINKELIGFLEKRMPNVHVRGIDWMWGLFAKRGM